MTLVELGIAEKKVPQFNKIGINEANDLITFWPRRYHDRTKISGVYESSEEAVFVMRVTWVEEYGAGKKAIVKAYGSDMVTGNPVRVVWFNQPYILNQIAHLKGRDVFVCGQAKYVPASSVLRPAYYQVANPPVFVEYRNEEQKIYPVYKTTKGLSEDYLKRYINKAVSQASPVKETLPAHIIAEQALFSRDQMTHELHFPTHKSH